MFSIGMVVMCVLQAQFDMGFGYNKFSYIEAPCVIEYIGYPDAPNNEEYPLLQVNCTDTFNKGFSFPLTKHKINDPVKILIGNSQCF